MNVTPESIINVTYVRQSNRITGEKHYRVLVQTTHGYKYGRLKCRTATGALEYGKAVVERYKKLIAFVAGSNITQEPS